MKKFAVIGTNVNDSFSPILHKYFASKFYINLSYDKLSVEPHAFISTVEDFFAKGGFGLNVTSPFKEEAYKIADLKMPNALRSGAVNVLYKKDGKYVGDNTDGIGLIADLEKYLDLKDKNIAILGSGGVVKAITPFLLDKFTHITVIARNLEALAIIQKKFPGIEVIDASREILKNTKNFDLVLNTLPQNATLEMAEKFCIQKDAIYYDLNYANKGHTKFVQFCKEKKLESIDGIGMLIEQAASSFYIWHKAKA